MRKIILLFSFLLMIFQHGFSQFIDTDGDMCIQVRYLTADYHYDEFITNDDVLGDPEEHTIRLSARVDEDINNAGWQGDTIIAYEGDDEVSQDYLAEFGGYLALNNVFVGNVPTKIDLQYFYWEDDCFDCKQCPGFPVCFSGCITCGGGPSDRFVYSENCPSCYCTAEPLNVCNDDDYGYEVTFEDINIRDFPPGCTNRGWFDGDNSPATDKPRVEVEICWTPPRPDFLTLSANDVCPGQMINLLTAGAEWGGNYIWEYTPLGANNWMSFGDFTAAQTLMATESIEIRVFTENGGDRSKSSRNVTLIVKTESEAPIGITASSTSTCPGNPVTLTAVGGSAGTGASLEWYTQFCGGFPEPTAGLAQSISVSPSETTTYYVRYEDDCTTETACASITIDVTPIPAPVANSVSACEEETITLEAFGVNGNTGPFNWYETNPEVLVGSSVSGPFIISSLPAGTYIYAVEEINMGCLSPRTYVTVSVVNKPDPPLATSPIEFCAGENIVLSASSQNTPSGTLIFYDNTNTQVPSNIGLLQVGTYNYSVTEFNGVCESDPTPIEVTVVPGAAAPIVDNIIACEGEPITLTAIAQGGDPLIWTDAAGMVVPEDQTGLPIGNHQFCVIEDNATCISSPSCIIVSVSAVPSPPTANPVMVCEGENIMLTATATGIGTTLVYYDSGGTVSISPLVGLLDDGTYTYEVAESNGNCESSRVTIMVTVDEAPAAPLVSDIEVCEGEPIILTATTSTTGGVLSWYDDMGPTIEDQTGLSPNDYTFCVEEVNGGCTSVRVCMNVSVLETPASPSASNSSPACVGDDVILSTMAEPNTTYSWQKNNIEVGTSSTISLGNVTTADAGDYILVATSNGCAVSSAMTTVIVNDLPVISGITNNGPLCEGETLIIDATTAMANISSYSWTCADGLDRTTEDIEIMNVTEADHQGLYTLVVTDSEGCESMPISTYVQIDAAAPSSLSATNSGATCIGGTVTLIVTGINNAEYAWSGPNGYTSIEQNPVLTDVSLVDAGTYTVLVTLGNCVSTTLETVVIVSDGSSVNAGADREILQGENTVLQGAGAISYTWSPATYLNNTSIPNPLVIGAPIGTYTYTVTGYDANLCSSTDEVIVTVLPNDNLEIVDLITPNGDGVNDAWTITYLENLEDYTIKIYARGGIQVYETNNYNNDWNGTYEGKDLPDGTYWYIIKSADGTTNKGAITVKR